MTNNILAIKAIRLKNELIWRNTRITIFIMIIVLNTEIGELNSYGCEKGYY